MRIGAIFARGSCRALKWTALLGTVFALAAGTAAAQTGVTITGPSGNKVNEGGTATYTVAIKGYVEAATDNNNDGIFDAGDTATAASTVTVTLTRPARPDNFSVTKPADGSSLHNILTAGETDDLNNNEEELTVSFTTPKNETFKRVLFNDSKSDISVSTLNDDDAENESFNAVFTLTADGALKRAATGDPPIALETAGTKGNPNVLIIDDDEEQRYTLDLRTKTPTEGTAITVNLEASPEHEEGNSGPLQVNIDKTTTGTSPPWTMTLNNNDNTANPTTVSSGTSKTTVLTITQVDGDGNRVADDVTVSVHAGVAGASTELDSLTISVADGDVLQAVKAQFVDKDGKKLDPQPTSVKEGETIYIQVQPLDKDGKQDTADEKLTVTMKAVGSADTRDYELGAIEIIAGQDKSAPVKLEIGGGDDDVGVETLAFDATVSGVAANGRETRAVAAILSIDIEDATEKKVGPKGTEEELQTTIDTAIAAGGGEHGLNPGESFTVMGSDLFTAPMDGYTVSYSSSVSGDGSVTAPVSGNSIEVNAVKAGTSTVTVTATATAAASSATISQSVSNVASVTFDVAVTDTPLSVTVAADSDTVEEGGTVTLTATASRAVTSGDGAVSVSLEVVGDAEASANSITIAEGDTTGTATLKIGHDAENYSDSTVTVLYQGSGVEGTQRIEIAVTNIGDEPPVEPTVSAVEGAAGMIAAEIAKAAGDGDWVVGGMVATIDMSTLFEPAEGLSYAGSSSDEAVVSTMTTGGSMLALTPMAAGTATIRVTGTDTASGDSATVTHDATVTLQTLVVEVSADSMALDEGGMATITASANRNVIADTTLSLTVTGDTAAVNVPDTLTIPANNMTGTATVEAVQDDDTADASVQVVVSGAALGTDTVSLPFDITDDDRTVVAKSQAEVTAVFTTAVAGVSTSDGWLPGGDAATVDMSALFDIADGASVEYAAESSAADTVGASVSGSTLSLTPAATGDATITVTATDTAGDADDHASVMADVSVGVLPLVVELSGPADPNLVEGESYDLTATANRPVTEATTVEIVRDRAASDAGDDDISVSAITIAAGETVGTTSLTVADDGPGDSGTGMPEALVLYGTVGNMQTNSLSFNIWDAAVPALPIIAQLLLAAFLAIGGYRRYLRR